jgi:hypothetical protein
MGRSDATLIIFDACNIEQRAFTVAGYLGKWVLG